MAMSMVPAAIITELAAVTTLALKAAGYGPGHGLTQLQSFNPDPY
jgi:hypothetical protein